ncbi:hypothetical protein GVX82_04850 [Patescibacteria group bacterium]|nr:hypothetical protein [Patescibacteria group bacterium]
MILVVAMTNWGFSSDEIVAWVVTASVLSWFLISLPAVWVRSVYDRLAFITASVMMVIFLLGVFGHILLTPETMTVMATVMLVALFVLFLRVKAWVEDLFNSRFG